MALNLYTSVGKGLKLKVRMFWGLISTFVEVTGEKMVGWPLLLLLLPHPEHVKIKRNFYGIWYNNMSS